MGKIIPYSRMQRKRREKKYGSDASRIRKLRAMGYSDDYAGNCAFDLNCEETLYGTNEDEEEDYWLGERSLTEVVK